MTRRRLILRWVWTSTEQPRRVVYDRQGQRTSAKQSGAIYLNHRLGLSVGRKSNIRLWCRSGLDGRNSNSNAFISYLQTQYNYTKRKCPSYPWICRCCNYVRKTALARRVKIEVKEHKTMGQRYARQHVRYLLLPHNFVRLTGVVMGCNVYIHIVTNHEV